MSQFLRARIFWLVGLACAIGASYYAVRWYVEARPLPLATEKVEVRIAPGATVRAIGQAAAAAGIGINVMAFELLARATGSAGKLRAGRFTIERGITLSGLLSKFRDGDVVLERLTIAEGLSFREMRAVLAAAPELRKEAAGLSSEALLKAVGATESHPEGLFAPETYLFDPGTSDLDLLRQAYKAQARVLQQAWTERAPGLPYKSPYEALIMASIIEKETGVPSERALIAGVFINRLKAGMLLQTDPTVIYGLGENFDGNLRKRDLLKDGPYNSYTRAGLPPTPIALPGKASIQAALKPADTNALYFVARGDGTSHFSPNLAEHSRAVDKYQRSAKR